MKRLFALLLSLFGTAALVAGVALLAGHSVAQEAQSETPRYEGTRECASCHRDMIRDHTDSFHAQTLFEVDGDADSVVASFDQGEELRTVQFPGEDAPRPFTVDDITYALAAGRNQQYYVARVEVDGAETYRVLPARWSVVNNQWEPFTPAANWDDPLYDFMTNCAGCHSTGFNTEANAWEEMGVQCEACHGPAEVHIELAEDLPRRPEEADLVEVRRSIQRAVDPQVCGACHSRGNSPFPRHYLPGEVLESEGFEVLAAGTAEAFYPSGHAALLNAQYNEWKGTGHESCATCHNNHTRVEGVPFGLPAEPVELCLSCHNAAYSLDDSDPHPVREMFEGLNVVEGVEGIASGHFTTEGGPTCMTCHMVRVIMDGVPRASHAPQPILPGIVLNNPGLTDTCSECHEEQASPQALQALIDDVQLHTRERVDRARAALNDSSPEWVIQALDFIEADGSAGVHNYTYAESLLDAVDAALGITQ